MNQMMGRKSKSTKIDFDSRRDDADVSGQTIEGDEGGLQKSKINEAKQGSPCHLGEVQSTKEYTWLVLLPVKE